MRRMSLQWRITIITTLFIAVICGCLTMFVYKNGVYYIDLLQDTVDAKGATDAAVGVLRTRLMEKARQLDPCLSIHDLRIVPGDTHTNVLFDLEFPAGYTGNKDEMLAAMCQFVHEQDPKYSCVVKVEQSYASAAHEK